MRIRSVPETSRRRSSANVEVPHLSSLPSTLPVSNRVDSTTTTNSTATATTTGSTTGTAPHSPSGCEINTNRSVWPAALKRHTRRRVMSVVTNNKNRRVWVTLTATELVAMGAAASLLLLLLLRWSMGCGEHGAACHGPFQFRVATRSLWLYATTASNSSIVTTNPVQTATATAATLPARTMSDTNHHSTIPRILIFTHSINLLTAHLEDNVMTNATTTTAAAAAAAAATSREHVNELITLQRNVRSIVALHPNTQVRFLTDEDCLASIRSFFVSTNQSETTTPTDATDLVRYFQREPQGMYKADLCRGTALYETGGIYLDVDLGVRLPLWDTLLPTTEFATVRVHGQSHYPGAFFQAFIAVAPRHDVIQRYVQLFLQYYRGTVRLDKPGGPLGVLLLKRAYDEIQQEQQQMQLRRAVVDPPRSSRASLRHSMLSFTQTNTNSSTIRSSSMSTRLNTTSELWQEILYSSHLQHTLLAHVPPPTWGTRRACKFVVATSPRIPLTVPLYSRIAGSRMCPVQVDSGGTALKYTAVRTAAIKSSG